MISGEVFALVAVATLDRDAIEVLQQGSPLLKFGRQGDPHFRFFVVSENCEVLSWHSPKKPKDECEVRLSECELLYGQRTDVFERNVMSEHFRSMNLSFSLVYADRKRAGRTRTLDLVCKDRHEFDAWLRGLAFLVDGPPPEAALQQWNRDRRLRERTVERRRLRPSLQPGRSSGVQMSREGTSASFDEPSRQDSVPALSFSAAADDGRASSDDGDSDGGEATARTPSRPASSPASGKRSTAKKTTALSRNLQKRMRESNDVYTCGAGGWGQLGVTETSHRPFPQLVPSLLGRAVQRVACGDAHSLALTEGGEVWVWGDGSNGRLGTGGTASEVSPRLLVRPSAKAAPYEFAHIACGARHSLAIADGVLFAWGANDAGQLMVGDRTDRLRPSPIYSLRAAGTTIVDADGGAFHSAAVDSEGRVFTAGWNERGLLGIGLRRKRKSRNEEAGDGRATISRRRVYVTSPQWVRGFSDARRKETTDWGTPDEGSKTTDERDEAVSSGSLSSAFSEGSSNEEEEEDGEIEEGDDGRVHLTSVGGDEVGVAGVACGGFHTLALLEDGRVFAWGWNDVGQLGVGDTRCRGVPCSVRSLEPCAVDIAAGTAHSAAVVGASPGSEGEAARLRRVVVWGAAGHGQLGHVSLPPPVTPDRQPIVPVPMTLLMGAGDTSAGTGRGGEQSIPPGRGAISSSASAESVGGRSPLPLSSSSSSRAATPHSPLIGVSAVSCGSYHTAVVTVDGHLWVAGDDSHGQLGLSSRPHWQGSDSGDGLGSLGQIPPPAIRTGRRRAVEESTASEAGAFRLEDSLLLEAGQDVRPRSVAHQGMLMASVALDDTVFLRQTASSGGSGAVGGRREDGRREDGRRETAPPPDDDEEAGWPVSDSDNDEGSEAKADDALLGGTGNLGAPWSTIGTVPARLPSQEMPAAVMGPLRLPWSMQVDVDALCARDAPKERPGDAKWQQSVSTTVGRGLCRVESLARKEVRGVSCGGCHTCVTVATEWIDDSEASRCMRCNVSFTLRIRKHHCRSCGGIFCAKCSSHRIPLLRLGFIDPVRVCDVCFGRLQGMDYMSFTGTPGL